MMSTPSCRRIDGSRLQASDTPQRGKVSWNLLSVQQDVKYIEYYHSGAPARLLKGHEGRAKKKQRAAKFRVRARSASNRTKAMLVAHLFLGDLALSVASKSFAEGGAGAAWLRTISFAEISLP